MPLIKAKAKMNSTILQNLAYFSSLLVFTVEYANNATTSVQEEVSVEDSNAAYLDNCDPNKLDFPYTRP